MLTHEEIDSLLNPRNAERHKDGETGVSCTTAFDIVLAADAIIYALGRGRALERQGFDVLRLRADLDHLRSALAAA